MTIWKRSRPEPDGSVSLEDESHAWWAGRDELEQVFVPKKRHVQGAAADGETAEPVSDFESRYSTESLFNWAAGPEPDDPTHGGNGTPIDPYGVLGLQPGASLSEVVAAHRALAKKYHPDQYHSADDDQRHDFAQRMAMINAAYQELRTRLVAHRHTV